MDPLQFTPRRTLRELEQKGRVNLPHAFGGPFSDLDTFNAGSNETIMVSFKRDGVGIQLTCRWKGGSGSGHIRSEDEELLDEIETMLPYWIGKSIDEVYREKF